MRVLSPRRPTLLVAGGALALFALSACGGGSTASTDSSAAAASPAASSAVASGATSGRADFTAYRDCMSKNGVTLPDRGQPPTGASGAPPSGMPSVPPSGMPSGAPGAGAGFGALPDGVDQATFDKAQAACASLRPAFGNGPGGGQIDATALAAFKSCLTDHKVVVASGQDWFRQLDRKDATVAAALKTCAPLMPVPSRAATPAASPAAS